MQNELNGYALYHKSAQINASLTINNVYLSKDKQLCTLVVNTPIDGVIYDEDADTYSIGKTRRVVMYTSSILNRLVDNAELSTIVTYLSKNRDTLASLLIGATVDIASLKIAANASSYITPEGETAEWGKDYTTIIHAIDALSINLANDVIADQFILATYTAAGIPAVGEAAVKERVDARLKKQLASVLKANVATAVATATTADTTAGEKATAETTSE